MENRDNEAVATCGHRERASCRLWRMISCAAPIVFVLGSYAPDAAADSLRCDGDLVRPGDSYLAVTDACGDPVREVALIGEDNERVGTALYYRGGYGQADRKVYLRGGTVTGIERLD